MKRFPHSVTLAGRLLALARPGIRILEWLALTIIIIGARLWLVANYGGAMPIHDQWDGEAAFLFKPWLTGTLRWADLFSPHNEHRIVLARLLSLGLLQLNGQWDPLLEIAVNTLFCGLIALVAAFGLRRVFTEANRSLIFAAVIFWLALPYAHENTLWGFQSSFYFLLFFSLMAIWGLGLQRPFSVPWCFGAFGAILACLTVSSGFFAACAALGMVALRSIKQRRLHRENVATVIVLCVITAVACYFRPGSPPWHEHLKASSVLGWLAVFGRCLAWPFPNYAAVALIMYLPLGLLALVYLTNGSTGGNRKSWRQMELLLGLGIWVILQSAAIAYGRGGDASVNIASRYMDILALGALTNFGTVIVLVSQLPSNSRWREKANLVAGLWICALGIGGVDISYREIANQSGRKQYLRLAEQHARGYVATGDRKYLEGSPPPVPYPDVSRLAGLLDDASLRSILPASIRLPLRVERATDERSTFVPGGYPLGVVNPSYERAWGSFTALGAAATGTMESASIHSRLPYLQLELAGYLRQGSSLTLRNDGNNKTVRYIPTTPVDPYWRRGSLAIPGESFRIIARDENPEDWFAFREPRELGCFSCYAERLVSKGKSICLNGIVLWVSIVLYSVLNGITAQLRRWPT